MLEMPERRGVDQPEIDRNGDSTAEQRVSDESADLESSQPQASPRKTAGSPAHGAIVNRRIVIPPDAKRIKRRAVEQKQDGQTPEPLTAPPAYETPEESADATTVATGRPLLPEAPVLPVEPERAGEPVAPVQPPVEAPVASQAPAEPVNAPWSLVPSSRAVLGSPAPPLRTENERAAKPSSSAMFTHDATSLPTAPVYAKPPPAGRRRLEVLLWALAAVLVVVAVLALVPVLFPDLLAGTGLVPNPSTNPTSAALVAPTTAAGAATATVLPGPTETVLPTEVPTRTPQPTLAPIVLPTPPADGVVLSLVPDLQRTGWVASNEEEAHWGDATLFAGSVKDVQYTAVLQFYLNNLPPGSQVSFAALELTGRDAHRLGTGGQWNVELFDGSVVPDWSAATPAEVTAAPSLGVLGEPLRDTDLAQGQRNRFEFDETQRKLLEQQFAQGYVSIRLTGSSTNQESVFGWESGSDSNALAAPSLYMVVVPGKYKIVTNTPFPRNVLTAAANVVRGTDAARRNGTPTRFSPGVATATPGGEPVEIGAETAIPGNEATAIVRAQLATAIARTTGTYTPTPVSAIIIFPTATPVIVPPNQLATATPVPPDVDLLQVPIDYERCQCKNRIVLLSNRIGGKDPNTPIVIDPDGTFIGKLSTDLFYLAALAREPYSPDLQRRIVYPRNSNGIQEIGIQDLATNEVKFITNFPKGISYDGAWAPDGSAIAFVSTERGNTDEIYVYDFGTEQITRITDSSELGQPWNKHPSWSPDGQKIVFWSSRETGHKQIWTMNRDGSGLTNISSNAFTEIDPVWVK